VAESSVPTTTSVGFAILGKSGRIEIVSVTSERGKEDEIEGADIGQHLARHGLRVDVHRISGGNIDVGDALLPLDAKSSVPRLALMTRISG